MKTASSSIWLFACMLACHTGLSSMSGVVAFVQPAEIMLAARPSSRPGSSPHAMVDDAPSSMLLLAANDESPAFLWAIRAASAVFSYVGLVGYYDRPRGQLLVNDAQVVIKPSTVPGAGLGLFARQNLSRGTVLGNYPGVVIPLSQNLSKLQKHPQCEAYIWRFSDNAFVIDPTNEMGVVDDVCTGGRDGLPGSQWLFRNLFRLKVPTTLCRINEPPLGKDVNVVTDEDLEGRFVTFSLERDVAAGEEFFIDYGLSYDRSMYGGNVETTTSVSEDDTLDT